MLGGCFPIGYRTRRKLTKPSLFKRKTLTDTLPFAVMPMIKL